MYSYLGKRLIECVHVSVISDFWFSFYKSPLISRDYISLFISARLGVIVANATTKGTTSVSRACNFRERVAGSSGRSQPRDVPIMAATAANWSNEDGSSFSRNSPREIKLPPYNLSRITVPSSPNSRSASAFRDQWTVDHRRSTNIEHRSAWSALFARNNRSDAARAREYRSLRYKHITQMGVFLSKSPCRVMNVLSRGVECDTALSMCDR